MGYHEESLIIALISTTFKIYQF